MSEIIEENTKKNKEPKTIPLRLLKKLNLTDEQKKRLKKEMQFEKQKCDAGMKIIGRLIYNCTWENSARHKCNICGFISSEFVKDQNDVDMMNVARFNTRKIVFDHLTQTHPDLCYKCEKCTELFITKKEVAVHKRTHKQKPPPQLEVVAPTNDTESKENIE